MKTCERSMTNKNQIKNANDLSECTLDDFQVFNKFFIFFDHQHTPSKKYLSYSTGH